MSADLLAMLNDGAAVAAAHLWRACWQGGTAIALVWGACWSFPRWSPGVRCWLWRLAYLKLLAALLWVAPVELPLLAAPASRAEAQAVGGGQSYVGTADNRQGMPALLHRDTGVSRPSLPRKVAVTTWDEAHYSTLTSGHAGRKRPAPAALLLLIWWGAGACLGARTAREWRASRRLVRAGRPIREARLVECCTALCRRLGLRSAPGLLLSREVGSPVLVGGTRPAIVLPPSLLAACGEDELRLILAHELAHLKRRDLLWAWLPTLADGLFFFHPLVWLARREWRVAQEMACDELAVLVTGAPAVEYGQVVLKVAAHRRGHPFSEPAVASAAGAYQSLQRRLMAISRIRPLSPRRWRLIGAALAVTGAVGVVPWRVTERAAAAEGSSSNAAPGRSAHQQPSRPQPIRDHQSALAEQDRQRRRAAWQHQQRLAEEARLRRVEMLAHERRLAELAHLRRLAREDHERRLAAQDHLLRLQIQQATQQHQQRLAELERMHRLQQSEHERRLAEQEQVRFLQQQAHERRLAEQEHARRMNQLAARPPQEEADQTRLRESRAKQRVLRDLLRAQQQRAAELQEQIARQQAQMAVTQHTADFLNHQLSELRLQQRALETQRQSLELRTRQNQQQEQLVREHLHDLTLRLRLQRPRTEPARPRAGHPGASAGP